MALNQAELQELAQLEAEEKQAQTLMSQVVPQGLTAQEAAELAQLEAEEMQAQNLLKGTGSEPVNMKEEANLGALLRAQYSLEPLESNRIALLTRELGTQNVKQDPQTGEVYVRQHGEFRPVNVKGFSVADIADFMGATPEMLGAGAGAMAGLGAGSIPGAIAGGIVGSGIRQGLSAMTGTPQVAETQERAVELGLSGAFSGAGAGIGKGFKVMVKGAIPKVRKIFPEFKFGKEAAKLTRIAQEEGIPSPTVGQLAGGRDYELEKLLGAKKIFGRGIRKQTDAQVDKIKSNLKEIAGEFIDVDTPTREIGKSFSDLAEENIKAVKRSASQLFDEITEKGADITVPAQEFKKSLLRNFEKLGFFDEVGNPLKHRSKTGLTKTQYTRLQGIFKSILDDIDESAGMVADATKMTDMIPGQGIRRKMTDLPQIDMNTINTMRKFIDENIKEGKTLLKIDDALLVKMRESFMDVSEEMLSAKDPALKEQFKNARSLWKKYIDLSTIAEKGGKKGLAIRSQANENILNDVFKNTNTVKMAKELSDEKTVKEMGIGFVNDILTKKLGKQDQIGADAALTMIKKKKDVIKEALGQEAYGRLRNNLFYLAKIGAPVNNSKTYISQLMTELTPSSLLQGSLELGERAARKMGRGTGKAVEKSIQKSPERAAKTLRVISDPYQREKAYKTRGPKEAGYGQRN